MPVTAAAELLIQTGTPQVLVKILYENFYPRIIGTCFGWLL